MKSITQNYINEQQTSTTVMNFFKKYHVSSALKQANAYRTRGIPVVSVFMALFLTVFTGRSLYMGMLTGKFREFAKDSAYRLINSVHVNWLKFTTVLASRVINGSIRPLTSEERSDVLIVDDSTFERNSSKKVELLARLYDHAKHGYRLGFRMLTLGWSDGSTFIPVNGVLLSSAKKNSRINEAMPVDGRSAGASRRRLSMTKATDVMFALIKTAQKCGVSAKYILFDSWFASPSTLISANEIHMDVIAMIKRTPKMTFGYEGRKLSLKDIYSMNRKRRGRSRYLLSVTVNVEKDGKTLEAKVVFVRNRGNRKDYLCLISTDCKISEDEIIRIYGKRWDIEVFFKVCKSYLKLARECRSLSYDAQTAHVAVVFSRYMMLSVENRKSEDPRTLGELFFLCSDELADISIAEAFRLLTEFFRECLTSADFTDSKFINDMMEEFMSRIPHAFRQKLNLS